MNARSKVSFNKSVYAGAHKFAHVVRLSGAGKTLRLPPSTKRYDDFQFGITAFQLLKLMEGAAKAVGTNRIGGAINTLCSAVGMVQRCFAVCDLALIAIYAAKCIIQRGEERGSATGCNIFHRVPARLHATLSEVADYLSVKNSRSRLLCGSG